MIVVDNASTDGAADMAAAEFPQVVLLRNERNRGFASASNQAAAQARGRYLFFLNNDTELPENTVGDLVDFADKNPEAGLIGPCLRGSDGRVQVSCRPKPSVATLLHRTCLLRWTGLLRRSYRRYRRECLRPAGETRQVETLMGAAMLLPREVFTACGGWDEDYTFGGEDFDLSTRIGRRWEVIYHPAVHITHHGRAATRANVGYSAPNVAIGFARFLRKSGGSPGALLLYKTLVSLDAPVQLALKAGQYAYRCLQGKQRKAEKSRQRVKETWYFLTRGLREFWRV